MMHYEFLSGLGAGRDLSLGGRITVFSDKSVGGIKKVLDDPGFTHAWVHRSFPFVEAAMGIELAPRSSHLLRRVDGDWVLARSWPYDGYEDPHTQPD